MAAAVVDTGVLVGMADVDDEHTHADVTKARELFGYEPTRTIREGVGEFIEWYRANREWYEPLVLEF